MKNFTVLFFIFSFSILYSQNDYRDGYVITKTNDTLWGTINYLGDVSNSEVCYFKTKSGNSIKKYFPSDILSYRFLESGKYYVSKNITIEKTQKSIFLEYLINGRLNVYYYRDKTGDHYMVDKDTLRLRELSETEELVFVNGTQYTRKNNRTELILKTYLSDCPELFPEIVDVNLDHKTLMKLAKDYQNITCKDQECIIYEKKLPTAFYIGPIIGLCKYDNHSSSIIYGGYIHIWLPKVNEKFYLETGLVYGRPNFDSKLESLIRIPLVFEYVYPKGAIRPTIGLGYNFCIAKYDGNTNYDRLIPINIGILYNVSSRVVISAIFNSEFTPLINLSAERDNLKYISSSLIFGVRYKI
jgi:hypothetical protein